MTIYVWTDSLWVTDNNSPIILLFGRNYHDKTITKTFTVRGFTPYFYAPSTVSTGLIDALGRPIKKVIARFPSDIPRLRERFDWTDEADILFDKRFLIDNKISYAFTEDDIKPVDVPSPIDPRVLWIDIEILGKSIPNPAYPSYPIVSIQLMDSYTKEITIFTYQIPKCDDVQVCCKSEHELLVRFADYVHQLDPDIISGWNSNEFDLPYIINRARTLGVSLIEMCRIYREPSARNIGGRWNIKIHGRQCFDFLEAFRKYYAPQGQLDSYRLKSVISNRDIMGDDAYSYDDQGGNLISLFENEQWFDIISYCKNDVVALDTINNKINLIEFFEGLRMISGVKIEETLANSRVIESIIMRAGIRPVPTKHTLPSSPDGYEGAIVLSPPIGIHDNVGVIDLTSLYPNIMVGFNISPDIDGVIPNTLRIIMEERDKIRKLRLEGKADDVMVNKETVLKYLANSFYGVIGWPQFRLYDKEQASKVTG